MPRRTVRRALALARRRGARDNEVFTAGNLMYVLTIGGRFEEAFRLGTEMLQTAGEQLRAAAHIHARLAVSKLSTAAPSSPSSTSLSAATGRRATTCRIASVTSQ